MNYKRCSMDWLDECIKQTLQMLAELKQEIEDTNGKTSKSTVQSV